MPSIPIEKVLLETAATPLVPSRSRQEARRRFESLVTVLELTADLCAALSAALLAHYTYEVLGIGKHLQYPARAVVGASLLFAVLFVLLLEHAGAYQEGNSLLRIRETERILRVSVQAFALVLVVAFFFQYPFPRWIIALGMLFVPVFQAIEKQLVFVLVRHLHSLGFGVQNVVIYGAGYTGRRVFSALVRSPKIGLNPIAVFDDNEQLVGRTIYGYGYNRERSAPIVAGPPSCRAIRDYGASMVVIAIPSLRPDVLSNIAAEASAAQAAVAFVPRLWCRAESMDTYMDIDGILVTSHGPVPSRFGYEAAKRTLDLVAAFALTILTAPLWAVIALLVRYESHGPVLFHQDRVGLNGRAFRLYKFRSMKADTPVYDIHPTRADDPRITRTGRWLRRTGLDEIPQLVNVLRGDMSLVGPRPEMPFITHQYTDQHRLRLQVKPGITGLWQLSADRAFPIHENIQYDLYYIRNRSLFMDIAILLHTLVFAMKGV